MMDRKNMCVRLALGGALFMAAACGQGPANNAVTADSANGATANQTASPTPHPLTMEPDPANQTTPVARSVDAGFPEPCQAYVREIQACLDTLQGPMAAERRREIRLLLHGNRGTWLSVREPEALIAICRDQRGMLREKRRELGC